MSLPPDPPLPTPSSNLFLKNYCPKHRGKHRIKKSFKDLFSLSNTEVEFMDNESLNQMEIIRHILVHNSGVIDNKYLSRSKRNNEEVGIQIELQIDEMNEMINASINAIINLFKLANAKNNC